MVKQRAILVARKQNKLYEKLIGGLSFEIQTIQSLGSAPDAIYTA